MAESATHAGLVLALISFVELEFGGVTDVAIRDDSVRPIRGERPPRIHGYVPDIFATDVPTTTTLIGEAKTRADLETERSRKQITAFLRYLSQTSGGIFVLSVPFMARATARRLLADLNAPFVAAQTRTVVLDGTPVPGD